MDHLRCSFRRGNRTFQATYATRSMQDNRSVYEYAWAKLSLRYMRTRSHYHLTLTAKKLPSTSHAARMKSFWNSCQSRTWIEIGKTRPHRHPSRRTRFPQPFSPSLRNESLVVSNEGGKVPHICTWCSCFAWWGGRVRGLQVRYWLCS